MKEKLYVAKRLKTSRERFSKNSDSYKLCLKCYNAYVTQCIIKGKNDFKITFEGEYIESLPKRISDWLGYTFDSIYKIVPLIFTPNNYKTLKKYGLAYYGALKPIHSKITKTPNEFLLYDFLEKNGLKIAKEYLYSDSTVYVVEISEKIYR